MTVDRLIFSRGSPNSLYVAVDTLANIIASYSAADYSGCTAWASDLKFAVRSNGTAWRPATPSNLSISNSATGIEHIVLGGSGATYSQTGTTVTVSLTGHTITADQNGARIHLTISTGTATTGWFTGFTYVNADTFTCTSSVSQSASGNLGTNTAETYLPTDTEFTFPTGLLTTGDILVPVWSLKNKNSGNNKTPRAYFGGVVCSNTAVTTATTYGYQSASNLLMKTATTGYFLQRSTAIETFANSKIQYSMQLANAGDWASIIPMRTQYVYAGL